MCQCKVQHTKDGRNTFVAITSWSRIPRFSAHSPMNCSEDSSWLQQPQVNTKNVRTS